MEKIYNYRVVEVRECYCPTDLECEITAKCMRGMRLVSVIPDSESLGTYMLVFEEQAY